MRTSRPCWSGPTRCARLAVRANADTPHDAQRARELGAEGIGLCRTEHMFMEEDRLPKMRAMIMAQHRRARREALAELLPAPAAGLRGAVRGDGRPAGDDPAARSAAARVPTQPRGPLHAGRACAAMAGIRESRRARGPARPRRGDPRGEPDARHPRGPSRNPLPGDLRDAGAGDHAGGEERGQAAASRDHDPARQLRARARADARAGGPRRRSRRDSRRAPTTRSGR